MNTSKRRSGFTLPEILVTVTIVAVLAAVVVPAVVQQVNKADQPSAVSDITGLRTGVNGFATDTRHFPRRLSQLTSSTLASTDSDIVGGVFGNDASRFHGPYLAASGKGHVSPSGIVFSDSLRVASGLICMADSAVAGKVRTSAQVAALDTVLDNGNGNATGAVTWTDSSVTGFAVSGTLNVCLVSKG